MDRLDKILEDLTEIKITQAKQAKDLKYHIVRSDRSERRITLMENVYQELKSHLEKVSGAITGAKWIGGLTGFIYLLTQIYDRFF